MMKRRRNICIKIIVAKGEEAQGKTGVLRLPVKFLLGGSETGVELHVSCVSDCAGGLAWRRFRLRLSKHTFNYSAHRRGRRKWIRGCSLIPRLIHTWNRDGATRAA